MARKLAVKRLTSSDLTFFEWQFKNRNAGNQKAINLNAEIFVKKLYPSFESFERATLQKIPIDVFIYGPGLYGEYNIQRKIIKSPGSKNWRLNGEFVYNPEGTLQRFNELVSGDFAIFEFGGEVYPETITIIFIADSVKEDQALYQVFDTLLGTDKMIELTISALEGIIQRANPDKDHPIYGLAFDTTTLSPEVEDIVLGGSVGREKLRSKPSTRKMSYEDLKKAKENADFVGQRGEQLVYDYLVQQKEARKIHSFEWVSQVNSISPYDFVISHHGVSQTLVDIKSTQGEFERTLHVSLNELRQMSMESHRYDIYRVFQIEESTAWLRIAEGVREFARVILKVFDDLPPGVSSDSISFSPTLLSSGSPIKLEFSEQEED